MTDTVLLGMLDRPCTIVGRSQSGPVDRYNQPTWLDTSVDTVCYFEQTETREVTEGRSTGIATHLFVFASGTEVDDSDQVLVDGVRFEILGPPWRVWEPGVGESHIEASARAVE